ncbi:signal peptidase I [Patescibacteria group bacterium]|nr:signal peptidase I [Patescibacteria group bacterium]
MEKRKFFKKVIGWIIYIGILAGLVIGTPKGMAYFLDTPYPMASITSGSMWPVLKRGDMVFVKGVKTKEDIDVGDIVVYKNVHYGFTIHRVINISNDKVITKGDANNTQDAPINAGEIIGKAVTFKNKPIRIPYLGIVSILLIKK